MAVWPYATAAAAGVFVGVDQELRRSCQAINVPSCAWPSRSIRAPRLRRVPLHRAVLQHAGTDAFKDVLCLALDDDAQCHPRCSICDSNRPAASTR